MPARPQNGLAAASKVEIKTWDQYVADTVGERAPYRQPLPGHDEPVEVPCPSSDAMDVLTAAQIRGDSVGMVVAGFGAELAQEVLEATAKLPFIVRQRMVNDLTMHYGLGLGDPGESDASSD